jgi:hypothetical protein
MTERQTRQFGPGAAVEVVNRFERRWSRGFEVVEVVTGGYRVRRRSDGSVLPVVFPESALRVDSLAPVVAGAAFQTA